VQPLHSGTLTVSSAISSSYHEAIFVLQLPPSGSKPLALFDVDQDLLNQYSNWGHTPQCAPQVGYQDVSTA
jgi:hypothetical protein